MWDRESLSVPPPVFSANRDTLTQQQQQRDQQEPQQQQHHLDVPASARVKSQGSIPYHNVRASLLKDVGVISVDVVKHTIGESVLKGVQHGIHVVCLHKQERGQNSTEP
jgi:hypothetical protein